MMGEMEGALYDHFSPEYWVRFGLYENAAHCEYLQKFLERVPPHSSLLSAACGVGRYDGLLLESRHSLVGINQSAPGVDSEDLSGATRVYEDCGFRVVKRNTIY